MAHPILMPKPGQMTEECTIVAWHKAEGDAVRRGDVLLEIETDKANMDVEAFDDGVLLQIVHGAGETVPVNTICAYIGDAGEAVPAPREAEAAAASASLAPLTSVAGLSSADFAASTATAASSASAAGRPGRPISPRAARLVASSGIDPRAIIGTGPGGRVVERDVRALISAGRTAAPLPLGAEGEEAGGRAAPAAAGADAQDGAPDEGEPQPMSRMRRVIAERLSWSAANIPHFAVTVAVDMTRLLALRAELKRAGTLLSVTDFILAATAQTLTELPEVNSRTDGTSVWLRRRVHLGLAVSVPNGLVVPVIRDADHRSLQELHDRAAALAEAAREGTLSIDDMTGSTFSVSNLGMFGVDQFSAIINPGEAAILAVSSVLPTAVALGDGLAVRQVMKLTLSADHRLIDGELGARFLNALRRRLEDAESFRADLLNA